jgi:hypothetical protein
MTRILKSLDALVRHRGRACRIVSATTPSLLKPLKKHGDARATLGHHSKEVGRDRLAIIA